MDYSLYKSVVELMQEGMLVVDTSGQILAVNPSFLEMTGYESAELVGKPCTVLNCSGCKRSDDPERTSPWCQLFEKGGIRSRRCEITSKDGRTIYVVKHATVLHDERGEVTGAVETMSDISELVRQEAEIHSLRCSLYHQGGIYGILGTSKLIRGLLDLIENVGQSDAPVLIYGESGVGKELVARAVHESGPRFEGPFIKVNCTSLNENLLESELFGHVKGAFTGAGRTRIGRFEAASGGSIFLDEIGDISAAMQAKLLRVLEAREIERVGDHRPIAVDAKVITATNKNLEELVARGGFREDLFYRISVVPIHVPPLREHKEDIPLIAQSFIDKISARSGKPITGLSAEARRVMDAYDWPGNVRELRNTIEYAFVLCHENLIDSQHLPPRLLSPGAPRSLPFQVMERASEEVSDASERERRALVCALGKARGCRTEAARILGVSRVTVWKRMKKHGLIA